MSRIFLSVLFVVLAATAAAAQDPSATPPPQQTPPTQTQQPQTNPGQVNPTQTQTNPTQPTGQPQTNPAAPQTPVTGTPSTNAPALNQTAPTNPSAVTPNAPTSNVGSSGGVAPAVLPGEPPPIAPNFEAPIRPLPSAERVGVDIMNQLSLSLDDAIKLALQNNNDIDSSKIDVRIAEFNLKSARGVYDPVISGEGFYESRTTPTASTIGGAGSSGKVTQRSFGALLGGLGFSPYAGGSYTVDFSSSRTTTNNQNSLLDPQFPSSLIVSYTQPLWRGFRFDIRRRNIEIAKKNLSLSDSQFRQRVIEVISQVEQAYWDLAYSLRNLQVQIDAVKQARTQLESNRRLVAKGVLAPIEVIAATTQITTFEQNVYTAQEGVTQAENTLKTLILKSRASDVWSRPLTPVTPVEIEAPPVLPEVAVNDALKNRLELQQIDTNKEINNINERFYRDQTKPQIDLVGTYTGNGLSGTANVVTRTSNTINPDLLTRINQLSTLQNLTPLNIAPTTTTVTGPPDVLVGNYLSSLTDIFGLRYPTYRVGVRVSLPLGNRVAEAELGRTLAEGSRLTNQRLQQEQLIEAEVRNALQSLRSAEARLQSAAATRISAEQLYESEQRQFRAGTTTVFLVLQRQNELLVARSRELQAQTDLNKAIGNFRLVTGTTLEANGIQMN